MQLFFPRNLGLNHVRHRLSCLGIVVTFAVAGCSTASKQTPLVTLTATPSSVQLGQSATLQWSADNANSCEASGGWSGAMSTTGSAETGALNDTTDFKLVCTGPGGDASQVVVVSVGSAQPTITLTAQPSTVGHGDSSTLTWSSTDATECTASGGWSGAMAPSGSQDTGSLIASTDYDLSCTGTGGTATQSITVTVDSVVPTVTMSASPSTIASGESATITWSSTDASACTASDGWSGDRATSGSASTGALSDSMTYALSCTGPGGTASQSATVTVSGGSNSPAPTVSLSASPSTIANGDSTTLTWSSTDSAGCTASGAWSGARATSGSQSSGALASNASYTLSCSGAGGTASQTATVTVKAPSPAVTLSANPKSVSKGANSTLTWSSSNSASCTASGGWSGALATSGSKSVGPINAATTYKINCAGPGGSATQSTSVGVVAPIPTVSLSVSPSTVVSGSSATLTWSSTDATSCTASGSWSGSKATSGTEPTAALSAAATYVLNCTGPGGTAKQSVSVTVTTPASVTVDLLASPVTVASGASSMLNWSAANASSCTASGGWTGSKSVSGSTSTGSLTATKTYTLNCSGTGGSASDSVTVTVDAAPPTLNFTASPASVASGGSATLTWSATNATSCTASGAWTGSKSVSGTASTGALTTAKTYTLACTGSGGTASQAVTVAINPPAPTVSLTASPMTVSNGGSSTLTWSSTNATSCTASGAWTGSKTVSGSASTGALSANKTYTLACTGTGGTLSKSVNVAVGPSISGSPATSVKAGSAYSFTPTASAVAGATLAFSIQNKPVWATFSTSTGQLSGTPSSAQVANYPNIVIAVSDGTNSVSLLAFAINVTSTATSVVLNWTAPTKNTDGSTLTDLTGYKIYYGTSAGALNQSVSVSGASASSYTFTSLTSGTWYFSISSISASSAESVQSNPVSTTL